MAQPEHGHPLFLSNGREVSYSIRLSKRAQKARLRINTRGAICLVLPHNIRMRIFDPQAFMTQHLMWIEKTLHRLETTINTPRVPPEHIALPTLNEVWTIHLLPAGTLPEHLPAFPPAHSLTKKRHAKTSPTSLENKTSPLFVHISEHEKKLFLYGDTTQTDMCCQFLQQWLRTRSKHILPVMLRDFSAKHGFSPQRISIRDQKTRWGSCSAKGNISLNYRAILLPPSQLNFLFLHELCHLHHLNHSPAYRTFLEQWEPHWRNKEKELSLAWRHFPTWLMPL